MQKILLCSLVICCSLSMSGCWLTRLLPVGSPRPIIKVEQDLPEVDLPDMSADPSPAEWAYFQNTMLLMKKYSALHGKVVEYNAQAVKHNKKVEAQLRQ